jgi:ribosome biogenesis ATPase
VLIIPLQIYQVVRKLADEQAQLENGKRLTVSTVYDSIKHSNSSLKRRSKKLLEDSIDRVLLVLRDKQNDSDSLDDEFEDLEEDISPQLKVGSLICRGQFLLTVPRKIIL